jgi:hypothetical protein
MTPTQHFVHYAAAFERAFESDDWSEIEILVAPDAVYEVGLPLLGEERREGRAEVVAWFKRSLDTFDRRFESRELALVAGPEERNGEVWLQGTATYRAAGVPPFVLELEETLRFEEGLLARIEDRYTDAMKSAADRYFSEYGQVLGLPDAAGNS